MRPLESSLETAPARKVAPPAAPTAERYRHLDGLRGLAALMVLQGHAAMFWGFAPTRFYLAVDLFFMLSGFVLCAAYGSKIRSGVLGWRRFMLARLVRLYPTYLLSALAAGCVYLAGRHLHEAPASGLSSLAPPLLALLFLPCYQGPGSELFIINTPYWSLFFELLINLLFPLVYRRISPGQLLALTVLLGGCLMLLSSQHETLDLGWRWTPSDLAGGFLRAAFGITLGMNIYGWAGKLTLRLPTSAILLAASALFVPALGDATNLMLDELVVMCLFPACILLAATRSPGARFDILLLLGALSYPLYVLHQPLLHVLPYLVGHLPNSGAPWSGAVFTLFVAGIALLVEKRFDEPIRQYLMHLVRDRPSG